MTSSRNCGIYNRVITRNKVIFRYIDMSMQDIVYQDQFIIYQDQVIIYQDQVIIYQEQVIIHQDQVMVHQNQVIINQAEFETLKFKILYTRTRSL